MSNKPTYKDSHGNRYTQNQINDRIAKAKAKVAQNQIDEYGYEFCSVCFRKGEKNVNQCKPIDKSHLISVTEAKGLGMVELSWDINNIENQGRSCHKKWETSKEHEELLNYYRKIKKEL